jgi:ketosteroid isomerase-like protein
MNSLVENEQTAEILNRFFESVSEKNTEKAGSFLSDNLEWYIPKSDLLLWTGSLTTRSEVVAALKLLLDSHVDGEGEFTPDHLFIDGNEAAVFGKASKVAKETGKRFTAFVCERFTIEDGKITKFLMLEDTREIEKAFIS